MLQINEIKKKNKLPFYFAFFAYLVFLGIPYSGYGDI